MLPFPLCIGIIFVMLCYFFFEYYGSICLMLCHDVIFIMLHHDHNLLWDNMTPFLLHYDVNYIILYHGLISTRIPLCY